MPPSFKLIHDFILPSLENKKYGQHLTWEDKSIRSFKISRIHQHNERFSQDCIKVYKDWSLKKKLWITNDPRKITKAKHRLITALRRNPEVEILDKESAYYRFRLIKYINSSKKYSQTDQELNTLDDENGIGEISYQDSKKYNLRSHKVDSGSKSVLQFETCFQDNLSNIWPSQSVSKLTQNFENETIENETAPIISSETFLDNSYIMESNGRDCNDKCCCILLLDSNFLPNKMCIWHGIFP